MSLALAPPPVLSTILEAIGHTPLVRLRLPGVPDRVELWGKCEWFNPGGSVKDRTALSIVSEGERAGTLRPGRTIIDSSSGNTAVGLALVGRAKGYPVELVMPESVGEERQRLCRAYGAKIVFTDPLLGSDGAIVKVREIVATEPDRFFYADQYRNPANPLAHYRTTGPEIWEQTGGRVTHVVAGLGTSGTVVGLSRFLRERNPRIRIVAVEPSTSCTASRPQAHGERDRPRDLRRERHDEKRAVVSEDAYAVCAEVLRADGCSWATPPAPPGRRAGHAGLSSGWWSPCSPTAASATGPGPRAMHPRTNE
jgi:cysteine synthase B